MRLLPFALQFLLPVLALAQETTRAGGNGNGNGNGNNVQLSTSIIVEVTLGPDRAESSVTRTQVVTITQQTSASSAQPTGDRASASGSQSASGSGGGNNSPARTTSTTPRNLPTASVDAGQTHSAPIPGARQGGGIYGPDDSYIAAASTLSRNAALLGLGGFVAGGLVMIL
ncbi:hypothetical protein ONZ45_g904 [Pleurotus djamor]|nr:hypothetical protein ONZ45_g904 [Pleurotus djamor]